MKSYLLVITVADGGSPQFTTYVTVTVQVTSTNEYAPVFSNSTHTVSQSEVRCYVVFASFTGHEPTQRGWVRRGLIRPIRGTPIAIQFHKPSKIETWEWSMPKIVTSLVVVL